MNKLIGGLDLVWIRCTLAILINCCIFTLHIHTCRNHTKLSNLHTSGFLNNTTCYNSWNNQAIRKLLIPLRPGAQTVLINPKNRNFFILSCVNFTRGKCWVFWFDFPRNSFYYSSTNICATLKWQWYSKSAGHFLSFHVIKAKI